jgi:hypothetical protein
MELELLGLGLGLLLGAEVEVVLIGGCRDVAVGWDGWGDHAPVSSS